MAMTGEEWLRRLADALSVPPPTPEETEQLLALAGIAAHASERTAAPVSCWLAARAGASPVAALEAGRALAAAEAAAEAAAAGADQSGRTRSGKE